MSDFLDAGERSEFDERAYPRRLQVIDRTGLPVRTKSVDLAQTVGSYLERSNAGKARGFHCIAVSAVNRDGITWAATLAADAIRQVAPRVRPVLVRDVAGAGSIPEIMRLTPRRRLASAARRSGVTRSLRMTSPWLTVGLVAAAVAAGIGVALLTAATRSSTTSAGFAHPGTWASAAALAAVAFISQQLTTWLKLDPTKPLVAKLAEEVDKQVGSAAYQRFVELLAATWATTEKLRCVVVENFSNSDPLTKLVLEWYLNHHANPKHPPELWVVLDGFEPSTISPFQQLILRERQRQRMGTRNSSNASPGARRTDLFEMLELSRQQRAELADYFNMPQRANFRRVKDICAPDKDDLELVVSNLVPGETTERDIKKFAAFELLYVLGVDSAVSTRNWTWSELIDTLSPTGVQRASILRILLDRGGLTRGQLTTDLRVITQDFGELIDASDAAVDQTLLVNPAVGELLGKQWTKWKLADPDLVHLYWGLYWFDRQSGLPADVLMVNTAAEHLAQTSIPSTFARQLGPGLDAIMRQTFDAVVATATACLRFCLLRHVPALIQLAHDILSEQQDTGRERHRSWQRLVRDGYTVLGDDRLLDILFDLETEPAGDQAAGQLSIADSLTAVFLESINTRHTHAAIAGARAGSGRLRALPLYAEVRGAWVALSLQPFAGTATPLMGGSAGLARESVQRLGRTAVSALDTAPSSSDPLARCDLMALSLALWCWAWSGDPKRLPPSGAAASSAAPAGAATAAAAPDAAAITDALETAYLIAGELCNSRFGTPVISNDLDFVLDCLAEELLASVAGAALFVLARWPQADTAPHAGALEHVLRSALEELGLHPEDLDAEPPIRSGTVQAIEDRLAVLHVVFRRLGFVQLADHLNIRCAQLGLFQGRDETTISSGLAENMQQSGLTGVLANVALAERVRGTQELSAELLVHAAQAAIAGVLGDDLTGQLGLTAMRKAHSFETDLSDLIAYLMAPHIRTPAASRLHAHLEAVRDEDLSLLALSMSNVAVRMGDSGTALMDEVRARVQAAPDPARVADVVEVLDIYDYHRATQRGDELDQDAVLDQWSERGASPNFPYVLFLLLDRKDTPVSTRLADAITGVLGHFRDYLAVSGMVLLAYRVARRGGESAALGAIDQAMVDSALKESHRQWEGSLSVQFNIAVLKLLASRDPARHASYTAHLTHWLKVQLELDEQRRLPALLDSGRWALLFLDYCYLFNSFGLNVSTNADEPPNGNVDTARLVTWLEAQPVPDPLMINGRRRLVSGAFYVNARLLFEGLLRDDPAADDIRAEYDYAAQRAMPDVYRLLADLDRVPRTIKSILDRHRELVEERLRQARNGDPD